jgi:hypothetical protein
LLEDVQQDLGGRQEQDVMKTALTVGGFIAAAVLACMAAILVGL